MASLGAAAILGGSSLLGGIAGGKGAQKAAKAQAAAYQKGIDEQNHEFSVVQGNEAPYMQAGTSGLASLMTLLGLGGGSQADAINALKATPTFTAPYQQGVDTILANASATGGLRGGNTQNSLATFGGNLLNSVVQDRLSNLGNLVSIGQNAASGTNSAALQTGNNVSNLLGQQGQAYATSAAAPYAAFQQILSGLGNATSGLVSSGGGGWSGSGPFPSAQYGW